MNILEIRTITPDDKNSVLEVYRQCEDFLALGLELHASLQWCLRTWQKRGRRAGFSGVFSPAAK